MDSQRKNIDKFTFLYSQKLGEGSFGQVYKGQDTTTGEPVAVKMLDKRMITADEYLMEGLHNQIEVMKTLKSKNIVSLIDVLQTSNNYYIVQEYCNEGDMRGVIKKQVKLSESEATRIFADLLKGFMELITHGIIHRDLKPENILVNDDMYKLADFGFARSVDNFQKGLLTSQVGTPLYMSPQILKHQQYTTKSDIWSLGQIFYEMIYGHTPWPDVRSQWELITKINENQVPFPSSVPISSNAQDLILQCLELEEKDRISWEGIFQHPQMESYFGDYQGKLKKLEDKALFLINELRIKIYANGTDLETVFRKYDKNNSKNLNTKEFREMMRQIDNQLTNEEIQHVFNKLDEDNSGEIQFNEFQKWLEDNNIQCTQRGGYGGKSNIKRLTTDQFPSVQHNAPPQLSEYRARDAIRRLQESIDYHKLIVADVFKHFDQSKNNILNIVEFSLLLQQIDQTLEDEDIRAAFTIFDSDFSGTIELNEFSAILKNPQPYNQPPPMNYSTGNMYNHAPPPNAPPVYNQYLNAPGGQPNYYGAPTGAPPPPSQYGYGSQPYYGAAPPNTYSGYGAPPGAPQSGYAPYGVNPNVVPMKGSQYNQGGYNQYGGYPK